MFCKHLLYFFLSIIISGFLISCKEKKLLKNDLVVQPAAGSEYRVTTKLYTHLERSTRDALLAMNLVGNIEWSIGFEKVTIDTIEGYFKFNSIRNNLEIISPSSRNYEINTIDTLKALYEKNSKPYAALLENKHRFILINNRIELIDSTYFNLSEALPCAHKEDLVSEQFFLLFRDQAVLSYLEHLLLWQLPDTVSGSKTNSNLRIFQGLTLEVSDTLIVTGQNDQGIALKGTGSVAVWHGLSGIDGILSKKNQATGKSDILVSLNSQTGIPNYINIHVIASGKALNYQTMFPFDLETDIKHTLSDWKIEM
jgi:hypothetical protein